MLPLLLFHLLPKLLCSVVLSGYGCVTFTGGALSSCSHMKSVEKKLKLSYKILAIFTTLCYALNYFSVLFLLCIIYFAFLRGVLLFGYRDDLKGL